MRTIVEDPESFRVGGPEDLHAALEFDLSSLLPAYEDPDFVDKVSLRLGARMDVNPFSEPQHTTVVGEALFFTAEIGSAGSDLWKADGGTAAGISLVKDILPWPYFAQPDSLTAVGDLLFFAANESDEQTRRLWVSDGTEAGTYRLDDSPVGAVTAPRIMTEFDGRLFFIADSIESGTQLFRTTGSGSNIAVEQVTNDPGGFDALHLLPVGNKLFLSRSAGVADELWVSDGTPLDRQFLGGFRGAGADNELLKHAVAFNGILFFSASDSFRGVELWRSNGTTSPGGTVMVKDIAPGQFQSSYPRALKAVNNRLLFTAFDRELWQSDGTEGGTTKVADIFPSVDPNAPKPLAAAAGNRYFVAVHDGQTTKLLGVEVEADGSVSILGQWTPEQGDDTVHSLTALGDQVAFVLQSPDDSSVYLSDGTDRGTFELKTFEGSETVDHLAVLSDRLYFRGTSPADSTSPFTKTLWVSHGEPESTHPLAEEGVVSGKLRLVLLVDEGDGVVTGRDMVDAGTYYLRVFNPDRDQQEEDVHFQIGVKPPNQGAFHPLTDADLIEGGEGKDILVGNEQLDRLFGQSGGYTFLAEDVEVRDRPGDDKPVRPPAAADRLVSEPPEIIDPLVRIDEDPTEPAPPGVVEIADLELGRVLAEALGVPLVGGSQFALPVHVTDLAKLVFLDASGRGIEKADGLQYASNLTWLNLADNLIGDVSMLDPARDEAGAATGLELIRHLNLDHNPLRDVGPVSEMLQLRVLSINDTADFAQPGLFAEYFVGIEGQELVPRPGQDPNLYFPDLSLLTRVETAAEDKVDAKIDFAATGDGNLNAPAGQKDDFAVRWTGQILISHGGPVTFFLESDEGSRLYIDGQLLIDQAGSHTMQEEAAEGTIVLSPGYHDLRLEYYDRAGDHGIILSYESLDFAGVIDKVVVPTEVLTTGGLSEVTTLAELDNLLYLSLSNNVITSADALSVLPRLEVLDLSRNEIRRIDQLVGARVIDDGDWLEGSYSETGQVWSHSVQPVETAFGGDYRFQLDDGQTAGAHWTFKDLPPGDYEVYATWHSHTGQTTGAKYTVDGEGDAVEIDPAVNQKFDPTATPPQGMELAGRPWQTPCC